MPTRISFMTHYPDRMGELAGKPTYFPEKILHGLELTPEERYQFAMRSGRQGGYYLNLLFSMGKTKTTTIRSNYEYWKSKEGQLIQPFFWAGKPYRSKHVVFCPEVRLAKVSEIELFPEYWGIILCGQDLPEDSNGYYEFVSDEGFDHPDHFWMWFDRDFSGAYLELESAKQ